MLPENARRLVDRIAFGNGAQIHFRPSIQKPDTVIAKQLNIFKTDRELNSSDQQLFRHNIVAFAFAPQVHQRPNRDIKGPLRRAREVNGSFKHVIGIFLDGNGFTGRMIELGDVA